MRIKHFRLAILTHYDCNSSYPYRRDAKGVLFTSMEAPNLRMLEVLDIAGPGEHGHILKPLDTTNASILAYGVTMSPHEYSKYLNLTFSIMVQLYSLVDAVEPEAKPIIKVSRALESRFPKIQPR